MKRYIVVTTNGLIISLIAEGFERNKEAGRLAFRIGNSWVGMFELSHIAGFYTVDQEGDT